MSKIIIYQMFTRLFGNKCRNKWVNGSLADNGTGKFNDITPATIRRIKDLGCTHIWFTGVIRHATCTDYEAYGIPRNHSSIVKGKAGSPYAITDYYDVDPDLATDVTKRMQEWEELINRSHKEGIKVIMDFVPNHVAREYHSISCPKGTRDLGADDNKDWHFSTQNNFYYCWGEKFLPWFDLKSDGFEEPYSELPAKATGNDVFSSQPSKNDWYETIKLNYGIDYCDAGGRSEHFDPTPNTWDKMTSILLFWASKGVDAFRCDMAEMVPTAFWTYATKKVKDIYPWIEFIGEVYDPQQYRNYINAGFDYLYDKVGMYDTLRNIVCGHSPASSITNEWQSTDDIKSHMLYFLENHDEQRIASDFFAGNARKAIPALAVSVLMRNNPFMLYAGEEFGERGMEEEGFSGLDGRTTIFDYWCVESIRRGFYDRRHMKDEEREIENIHKGILTLANKEKVFSEGEFYDLMYANYCSQNFNVASHYAFIRSAGNEHALVIVNFSDNESTLEVNIPQHAFEYLKIKEGKKTLTELITNEQSKQVLSASTPIKANIKPYGVKILKIKS